MIDMMTVVTDLDGTLADIRHRLHFIESKPKRWDEFFDACVDDAPIPENIRVVQALRNIGHQVVVLTGRNERVREQTEAWLSEHAVPHNSLIMRPAKDFRPDHILKRDMARFMDLTPDNTLGILDDRSSVVRMWREEGFRVWQVADGDF